MAEQHQHYCCCCYSSRMMRKSIFTFLKNLDHLSSTPSLLLLPFAASSLLLSSPALLLPIPPNSQLSQSILSFFLLLPSSLSFLLLAKASIINHLSNHNKTLFSPFNRLLITQIFTSLLTLAINLTSFSLLAISFNVLGLSSSPRFRLLFSSTASVVYSVVLANTHIVGSLAVIMSVVEGCSGFESILKACAVVKGRASTALCVAVAMNLALAAVEALFEYRVMAAGPSWGVVFEGLVVAYLYALVVVIDTVVGYVFLESCRQDQQQQQRIHSLREVVCVQIQSL